MNERLIARMASATSWSPEARTASVVLSTDADVGDGLKLEHTRKAIRWPERPIPVVLDHLSLVDHVAGAVVDLQLQPLNGGTALVGTLQLDGPAADRAEPLLRTGAARWSIGARIYAMKRDAGSGLEVATDWAPSHLALVVDGQDPAAITRSLQTAIEPMNSNTDNTAAALAVDEQRSAKELRLERDILRMSTAGQLTEAQTAEALTCRSLAEASTTVVRMVRERTEAAAPVVSGGGVIAGPVFPGSGGQSLEDALLARLQRKGSISVRDLCESVVGRQASPQLLLRGAMSTTDFSDLFAGAGHRFLKEQYESNALGLRSIARRRESSDLRDIRLLGLSEFPALEKLTEGGEIRYGSFEDLGGSYRVEEFARGIKMTRRAFLSDDLSAFETALSAYGRALAFLEDSLVKDALETGATGAACMEDGLALFHANHGNTATGTGLSTQVLADALARFRGMTAPGMNAKLNLQPAWLVVPPAAEITARQQVAQLTPAQVSNANPFASGQPLALNLLVDANLSGSHAYLTVDPSSPAAALEITTGPAVAQVDSESEFETTSMKTRVLADRGLGVRDYRGIVRIALS